MRTRRAVGLLAAALLSIGLSGCASSNSGGHPTIVYWATQQTGSISTDQKLLTAELRRFTDRTGIKVHLEIPTWPTLYGRILTAVTSGRGPDVVNIGNTWSAALQATQGFLPFDSAAMKQVGGADRFLGPSLASTGAVGKTPTSLPRYGEVYALYYNRALFRAAGITRPPATWADFVADAKRLTMPGQWGVGVPGASGAVNAHFAFILGRQQGAQLFDAAGRPHVNSAAEQAAVRRYLDLLATDKVMNPSAVEHTGFEDQGQLAKGKVAMTFAQSGAGAYFAALHFADYGVAPVPTQSVSGGAAVESMVGGTNVSVLKKSPHRSAALQLVRFLTSDTEQVRLNKAYGSLPVVRGAYSDPAFSDPAHATFRTIFAEHAEPMPMVAQEGKMETVLGDAITALWSKAAAGRLTAGEVAAALNDANQKLGGPS